MCSGRDDDNDDDDAALERSGMRKEKGRMEWNSKGLGREGKGRNG